MPPTIHCTVSLSAYKKDHSCGRDVSCHGLTFACARAIWEFPSPTRTLSSWLRGYLKWVTCLWFPGRQAGACRDMTNTYTYYSSVKAARPWLICNMPTELWTSRATHISWPRSCAFLLPQRSRSERLLFGWLDGPSHYGSKQRSLSFYRCVGRKGWHGMNQSARTECSSNSQKEVNTPLIITGVTTQALTTLHTTKWSESWLPNSIYHVVIFSYVQVLGVSQKPTSSCGLNTCGRGNCCVTMLTCTCSNVCGTYPNSAIFRKQGRFSLAKTNANLFEAHK